MPSTPSSRHIPDVLLRNTNFVLLWCAYAVSALGDHLSEMAILKTQGALLEGVDVTPMKARMTFAFFLPFALLAPFAGVLADRLPRRGLMVFADLARCLVLFFFASLIAFTQDWGAWGPFMPLLMVGAFAAVFSPARSALLPTLIHPNQLIRANGLISGLGIIATMAANLVGGYLAETGETLLAFRLNSATFVFSAVLLMFIHPPRLAANPAADQGRASVRDLVGGFRYALAHRHVLELIVVAGLVWGAAAVIDSVIPAVVRDVYGGTYQQISTYRALVGAGFILGAVLIAVLGDALRSEVALSWSLVGIGGGIAVFALSIFLPLGQSALAVIGAVGIVVGGMFTVGVMASFNSLLQRTVANRFRGRVFGVKDLWAVLAMLVATGLLGIPHWTRLDDWVGWIVIGVAAVMVVAGIVAVRLRLARSQLDPGLQFIEHLNEFLVKAYYRFERVGRATVPRSGAAIVTSNHNTAADPLFLGAAAPYRPLAFMIAAEYARWPVVSFFCRLLECIPVRRDGRDSAATRQAIRQLREGKCLGIFIEGGIPGPEEVRRPRDGVAMLALKTGAVVVPAYISGTIWRYGVIASLLTRHRVRVRMGRPLDLSAYGGRDATRAEVRAATMAIYKAIWALAPEEERRRYAHLVDSAAPQPGHPALDEKGLEQEE